MIFINPSWYNIGCSDVDVVNFVNATGITDPTIINAICTLTTSLKNNGLWDKMQAIYPMVGGTATTHQFNLKNPANTDAAFRLAFNGGWTHSANGALPNGTNAYADPFLNPSTGLSLNSHSFGIYSRTNDVSGSKVYGAFNNVPASFLQNNLSAANFVSGQITNVLSYTANPSTSLLMASRTSNTLLTGYRAGTSIGTNTASISSLPPIAFYFGARNNSGATRDFFSNHQIAFAFFGSGLNSTESAALYSSVQAFQISLSRQV